MDWTPSPPCSPAARSRPVKSETFADLLSFLTLLHLFLIKCHSFGLEREAFSRFSRLPTRFFSAHAQ